MVTPHEVREKEKSQKLDEGVPRAPDLAISAEQIESASPIALCRESALCLVHVAFQLERGAGFAKNSVETHLFTVV